MNISRVYVYDRWSPRPSEDDGKGNKVPAVSSQDRLEALAEYARAQGWPTDDMLQFNDEECSRDDWNRPGLTALIHALRKSRGVLVLARHIDRIGSSGIVDWLLAEAEARGGMIHTIDNGRVDPSNPMAKFMAVVLGAFAELQRDTIARRTRDTIRKNADNGHYRGRVPPVGSRWIDQAAGTIEPIPEEVPALLRIHALAEEYAASGIRAPYKRIAHDLAREGLQRADGTAWDWHRVRRVVEASRPKRRKRRKMPKS